MNNMALESIELAVATEFSDAPGPRKRTEGDQSGEQFLQEYLRPRFLQARDSGGMLHVNLDGALGYPTSFLEEAFGGLAREFGSQEVDKRLTFTCTDEPYLDEQIRKYIRDANVRK
jgi:STAS-like domain of unknown function (DUF4325)